MMRAPITRLFIQETLTASQEIRLSPSQARQLRVILRCTLGDPIALFNPQDGEWLGHISKLDKHWVSVRLEEQVRSPQGEGESDIWLLFSPIKPKRLTYLVEKATELGASKLQPVTTERTIVDRINLDRLRANVIQAAQQSQRLSLPTIGEPMSLRQALADWPRERMLFLCAEAGPAMPMIEMFVTYRDRLAAILTGPEGGFTDTELTQCDHFSFITRIHLGSRLVRSETASLAALACWQAVSGEWTRQRVVSSSSRHQL